MLHLIALYSILPPVLIKLLMLLTMITASLIPVSGFKGSSYDIRIQYTHTHEHGDHDHENDVASATSEEDPHSEKNSHEHSHELVISLSVLTFIESKNNLTLAAVNLPARSYPKIQVGKLPLSHYLNSIFRPPIS